MVGSSSLEMRIFGQDRDVLLVDLMKTPTDQSRDTPVSLRHYLVFIEVARYMEKWPFSQKFQYAPNRNEFELVVCHFLKF